MSTSVLFVMLLLLAGVASPCAAARADLQIVRGEIDGREYRYVRDELLVRPTEGCNITTIASDFGAAVVDSIPCIRWFRLKLRSNVDALEEWKAIRNDRRIEGSTPRILFPVPGEGSTRPNPSRDDPPPETIQWPTTITLADQAWSELSPSNTLIAILDTGVDQVHYETGEFANSHDRILLGHNWCNPGAPPWDDHYLRHGTERLGEIAAPRGDEFGIAGIISGVEGPNGQLCKVLVEKVADGSSFFTDELAGGLIRVAIEEGARVISVSLWCYPPAQAVDPTKAAIEYLEECARYTIILACCLDTEQSLGYIPYPAAWSCDYDNVMAIGASTDEDTFWEYSEWRSGPLGGQVSLIAPGECTYWAAHADGSYMYGQAGGTSGATAHAAGIAGMMISKFPGLKYEIIKDRLQDSAKRIAEPEGCAWGDYEDCWGHRCWCDRPGSGRIDALYCLKPRLHVNCPRSGTAPGGHVSAAGSISGSHPDPGELVVYDLLGRRLCSVGVAGFPTNQAMLQSFVDREACIPSGPTIVRIVTDTEVRTWKIVK